MPPRLPSTTNALRASQTAPSPQTCICMRHFSSTPVVRKSPLNQKKGVAAERGKGGSLRLKKQTRARDTRPPLPGERLAIRKRIVLSNTNALEVPGLTELSLDILNNPDQIKGRVVALPGEVVDKLRAVEAFKVGQGWGFFAKPACLMREESCEVAEWMTAIKGKGKEHSKVAKGETVRRIIAGERKAGKSVLLLQAMTLAFLQKWVVINIPEARDLSVAQTDYAPVPKSDPAQYMHPTYTATLLGQIHKANTTEKKTGPLDTMKITKTASDSLPVVLKPNSSLADLALAGSKDPDVAWPVYKVLWTELTAEGRPPLLMCMDNVSHIMAPTKYSTVDEAGKLHNIHPYDFVLTKHLINCLSGAESLPNGGIVLAATSESEHAKSDPLRVAIAMANARRENRTKDETPRLPAPEAEGSEAAAPAATSEVSSKAPEVEQNIAQFWDPYKKIDTRILEPLLKVDTMPLQGFTKDEARAIIEYWAGSGMVRRKVDETLVNEKWTLAGGGIVGELEKAVVKARF